jgi:glucokinase
MDERPVNEHLMLGIDIGGTKTAAAVLHLQTGEVRSRLTIPTEAERGPEISLQRIRELVKATVRQAGLEMSQIGGIGIGCAGPLDSARGRIQNPFTLPTWEDVPIVDDLVAAFGLPTLLVNDAHAAALGEYWMGAGKGSRNMLYITISTGIGGGIIVDGKLLRGVGLMAGEAGHHVIDMHGPLCYCGARGCWEMLASGTAIARMAQERATEQSLIWQLAGGQQQTISAEIVSDAARQGDSTARQIMEETAEYLGIGIANLMNILGPDVIVLGGGVLASWDLLEATMFKTIYSRIGMVPFDDIRIVRAALENDSVLVGAVRALLDFGNDEQPSP